MGESHWRLTRLAFVSMAQYSDASMMVSTRARPWWLGGTACLGGDFRHLGAGRCHGLVHLCPSGDHLFCDPWPVPVLADPSGTRPGPGGFRPPAKRSPYKGTTPNKVTRGR